MEMMIKQCATFPFILEEQEVSSLLSKFFDNNEESESSEDELDIILHGTPEQKRRLTRSLSRGSLQMSSSEDDFEKEMEMELDATMKNHEKQFRVDVEKRLTTEARYSRAQQGQSSASSSRLPGASSSSQQQCYDEVYFDSDDEDKKESTVEGATAAGGSDQDKEQAKKQHLIPSNDDLLYDPNIDDDNQNWMNKQRAQYYPKSKRAPKRSHDQASSDNPSGAGDPTQPTQTPKPDQVAGANTQSSIPKTDAILNCPACMTTLCIDCQRHELYTNQYRAMFVMNCCIVRNEQLRYPESKKKKKKWRKKKGRHTADEEEEESGSTGDELFNPVKCSICNTEVGVLDKNEIFHFFNVLSSAA